VSERCLVSVLFADLVAFTTLEQAEVRGEAEGLEEPRAIFERRCATRWLERLAAATRPIPA
jgi:hypothetical protein